MRPAEHQWLDTAWAMEKAPAKRQKKRAPETDKSDQSGGSIKGEGVVTTTVIDGKPDWGEADKMTKKPSEEERQTKKKQKDVYN